MRTRGMALSLAWLAGATAGCSLTQGVRGVAVSRADCGGTAGAPIPSAVVHLECPGAAPRTATADAQGRFFLPMDGSLPDTCVVRVTREGYRELRTTLGDACAWGHAGECDGAGLYAELAPAVATAAASAAPGPATTVGAAP